MDGCRPKPDSWSSLPEDLALNILARLPLIEFHRLRTVCHSWNQLASDKEFRRLRPSFFSPRPGFALFLANETSSEIMFLDLNDPRKWRRIPFSFLPDCGGGLKFLASSGGLLLLGTPSGELLVVNPVTSGWRKLPPPEAIRDPFYTALNADAASGDFAVVVAESELRDAAATEVFESKTGRWRLAASPSRAGRWKRVAATMSTPWFYGSVPVYCKPVYCDGAFYHLTWDPEEMVSEFAMSERGEEEAATRYCRCGSYGGTACSGREQRGCQRHRSRICAWISGAASLWATASFAPLSFCRAPS